MSIWRCSESTGMFLLRLALRIADTETFAEMEVLGEKMEKLEAENQELKRELKALKDDNSGQ